jgi:hypothetical protein
MNFFVPIQNGITFRKGDEWELTITGYLIKAALYDLQV